MPLRAGTIGLGVALVAVYVVEVALGGGKFLEVAPGLLSRLGGNLPRVTRDGAEYWRLLTAAYLHGGLLHVAMNVYALVIIGSAVEYVLGAGWMYGAFVLSGITGSIVSSVGNKPNVVAIGASGGIFGLIAMAATLAFLAPRETGFNRAALVQWLVFGLAVGMAGGIDNWGHLGGIIGGALAAFAVAAVRKKPKVLRAAGRSLAALGLLVSVAAAVMAARAYAAPLIVYDDRQQADLLALSDALKKSDEAAALRIGSRMAERHPEDPIGRYFAGKAAQSARDWPASLEHLRFALAAAVAPAPARGVPVESWEFVREAVLSIRYDIFYSLEELGDREATRAARDEFCAVATGAPADKRRDVEADFERVCVLGYDRSYDDDLGTLVDALNARDSEKASRLGADIGRRYPHDTQAQYFAGKAEALSGRCDAALARYRFALEAPGPKAHAASKEFAVKQRLNVRLAVVICLQSGAPRADFRRAVDELCADAAGASDEQKQPVTEALGQLCTPRGGATGAAGP